MTKDEIISRVKVALRTVSEDEELDLEVSDLVDECLHDLCRAGAFVDVESIDYNDPLVLKACKLYAKQFYGYEENFERFHQAYQYCLKELCLRGGSNAV